MGYEVVGLMKFVDVLIFLLILPFGCNYNKMFVFIIQLTTEVLLGFSILLLCLNLIMFVFIRYKYKRSLFLSIFSLIF